MKKHFAVAGIIVLVFLSSKTPAFATMPVEENEYVRFDEFLLTVEQNLLSATADQIRNKYRGKPYIDFRESDYSASDFNVKQFVDKFSVQGLSASLQRDGVSVGGRTVSDLNELLKRSGLYEQVRNQYLDKVESSSLHKLKQEFDNLKCETYLPKTTGHGSFYIITKCETLLKRINRAALEEFYPAECPKIPKREFISVPNSFFYDFLAPFIERKETEKVKQFLLALNNKKVVYGYRIRSRGNSGCYVVDYSLEMDSDPSVPGKEQVYLVANKKPHDDGVCKGLPKVSNTMSVRMLIK